jgi:hypothetical protein
VLNSQLAQATATLLLIDFYCGLGWHSCGSGDEFSQSFPGIRALQYKVEGVLLRALQSLQSDEQG